MKHPESVGRQYQWGTDRLSSLNTQEALFVLQDVEQQFQTAFEFIKNNVAHLAMMEMYVLITEHNDPSLELGDGVLDGTGAVNIISDEQLKDWIWKKMQALRPRYEHYFQTAKDRIVANNVNNISITALINMTSDVVFTEKEVPDLLT